MLLVQEGLAFNLDHRAYFGVHGGTSPLLATASEQGEISLCYLTPPGSLFRLSVACEISSFSLHPSKPIFALIEGVSGNLMLFHLDGSLLFEVPAPQRSEKLPSWIAAGYTDCLFDRSGNYLLCATYATKSQVELELRETDQWSVVSRVVVTDPFKGCFASFHLTTKPETFAPWLAAGQDGSYVYWVMREGNDLCCALEPSLSDMYPPAFSPSGNEFLAIHEFGNLEKYGYPEVVQLGLCESPYGPDDPFGTSLCYLDNNWALAISGNGRIAVIDTSAMQVVNELAIAGHTPQPIEEYYPSLKGERQLCTDISCFDRTGDFVTFVYRNNGLLCFPVSDLLDKLDAKAR